MVSFVTTMDGAVGIRALNVIGAISAIPAGYGDFAALMT